MASGLGGGWRVAAIARTTPMAPTASTSAAISTARGGRWKSALESVMPHFLFCLRHAYTPEVSGQNLPEVMWAAASRIPRWATSANSA